MLKSTKWKKAIKLNQVNQWGNPCSPTFHPISIISLMARFWLQVTLLNGFMIDFLLDRTSQRLAAALSTLTPWWTWGSVCGGCRWRWPTWWTSRRGAGPAWRGAARCILSWCPIIIKIIVQVTNAGVTLPSAFTRERNNIKRKGIFRPRSMLIDDDIPMSPASPQGYFMQQHTDAKTFMEEHFMVSQAIGKGLLIIDSRQVKTSPFPSCHQIARKDNLWHSYRRMQQKYGRQHFDFLSDSFTIPEQREMLKEAMEREPGSYWIVKPPGNIPGEHFH